jgi:hypothetical protein
MKEFDVIKKSLYDRRIICGVAAASDVKKIVADLSAEDKKNSIFKDFIIENGVLYYAKSAFMGNFVSMTRLPDDAWLYFDLDCCDTSSIVRAYVSREKCQCACQERYLKQKLDTMHGLSVFEEDFYRRCGHGIAYDPSVNRDEMLTDIQMFLDKHLGGKRCEISLPHREGRNEFYIFDKQKNKCYFVPTNQERYCIVADTDWVWDIRPESCDVIVDSFENLCNRYMRYQPLFADQAKEAL